MSSHLPEIPEDMIIFILSKLPVKSLLRFMSVSKRWRSIISDPQFHKRDSLFLLAWNENDPSLVYTIDNQSSTKNPWMKVAAAFDLDYSSYEHICFTNSCDGMVLIGLNESLFLFNPLTRYFQKVLTLDLLNDSDYAVTLGFCYDASIKDYKAVFGLEHHMPSRGGKFVIVASLKGKIWDKISFSPFDLSGVSCGPLVNGRMHWTVYNIIDDDRFCYDKRIIWFDACKNVFTELSSPEPKNGGKNAIVGLGVLEGDLCMARRNGKGNFEGGVEVLIMKEYGVVESWTTMFVVSNVRMSGNYGDFIPLLFKKNGHVLLRKEYKIVVYSVLGELIENVEFPSENVLLYMVLLEENLVSPRDYHLINMNKYLNYCKLVLQVCESFVQCWSSIFNSLDALLEQLIFGTCISSVPMRMRRHFGAKIFIRI